MGRARAEHVRQVLEAELAGVLPKSKRFAYLALKCSVAQRFVPIII
jgi:hypothetical protein